MTLRDAEKGLVIAVRECVEHDSWRARAALRDALEDYDRARAETQDACPRCSGALVLVSGDAVVTCEACARRWPAKPNAVYREVA